MAKKAKGNRVQVILECTEMKDSGMPGTHLRLVLMFLMNKWFLTKKFRTSLRNNIIF